MSRKQRERRNPSPGKAASRKSKQTHPPVADSSSVFRMAAIALVGMAVLVGAGLAVWRLSKSSPSGNGPGFNVLLITMDTTRADYLGCYGHPTIKTPNIDALARGGTRFTQCMSAAPSTLPSHATIMTATYPYVHGARHNVGYRVSEANVTLAEVLEEAGYRTAAYVAAFVVNRDTGLDQGFDVYDDTGKQRERRADEVCDGAIDWLRTHADNKFFLWVHLFDPHAPYNPPPAFAEVSHDHYAGEIAFADQQIGRLIEEIRRLRLDKTTLVVLTADHGEGLGQHGESTHLYFVYDTTISVPLILSCPGQVPSGGLVRTQVRNVDIAPTILTFVGIPAESVLPAAQGVSLVPHMLNQAAQADLPAYGETLAGRIVLGTSPLQCLRVGGWKYIHAPRPELYNVRQDPGEEHNLVEREPDRATAMRDYLREIMTTSPRPVAAGRSVVRLDQNNLNQLESLGYVGGDLRVSSSETDHLAAPTATGKDPKDHKKDFAAIGHATECLQTGRFAQAEAVYQRLGSRFPNSASLQMHLARAMFLQGKFGQAITVYRSLLETHPEKAEVHYGLGKLLDRVGERTEAIDHFTAAVQIDPEYAEAHYDLGVVLMKEDREEEAVDYFRQAVRIRPTYLNGHINLGVALAATGKLAESVEQYQKAIELAPGDADIHYNLGNALLRGGDRAGAIQAYEGALRLKPDFAIARQALQRARQGS